MEKEKSPYHYKKDGKIYTVPCGTCEYLVNGRICPFVRCVKLNGWKVTKVDEKKLESL